MINLYYSFCKYESADFINLALSEFTGTNKKFDILRGKNNKPYVNEENLYFSLSHTEGLIICAVSNENIGADCEKLRSIKNKERIYKRFFKKNVSTYDDKQFLKDWTKFESKVKFFGDSVLTFDNEKCNIGNIQTFEIKDYIISVFSKDEDEIRREHINECTQKG